MTENPKFILKEKYSLNGFWEISNNGKILNYSGILELSKDDIRLRLFDIHTSPCFIDAKWNIIKGQLLTGEYITLVNCVYTGGTKDTRDILCNYVLSGKMSLNESELYFNELLLECDEHRMWLLSDVEEVDENSNKNEIIISKDKRKTFFDININKNINIKMKYFLEYCLYCFEESTFQEHYYFHLTNKKGFSLKEAIINYRFKWKMLLSFLVGQPCNVNNAILIRNNMEFKLFYRDYFYDYTKIRVTHWMFLPYFSIKKNIKSILKYWFKNTSKNEFYTKELFYTGFDTYLRPNQESFLALIKSLEGIVDLKYYGKYITESDFAELKEKVNEFLKIKKLNSKKRRGMLSKMVSVNEKKSLADKIQSYVHETIPAKMRKKLGLNDKYIQKICDARNKLSHNSGVHYFYVCKTFENFIKMNFVLTAMLLYHYAIAMKIPSEVVYNRLFENYLYMLNYFRDKNKK